LTAAAFLAFLTSMKQRTRDNLVYLTVGLGIAALVVADAFYADGHGREMWVPSWFAARLVYMTALLAYFVARETRRAKATIAQVVACVLFASVVNLVLALSFRRALGQLRGLSFWPLAVFELFLLVQLSVWIVQHLRPR
jgi:hypothetical protein